VFAKRLFVPVGKGEQPEIRFSLFDCEHHDKLDVALLVGEAMVQPELIDKGQSLTLQLTKDGKNVHDAFITFNPSKAKPDAPVTKFEVAVAARYAESC